MYVSTQSRHFVIGASNRDVASKALQGHSAFVSTLHFYYLIPWQSSSTKPSTIPSPPLPGADIVSTSSFIVHRLYSVVRFHSVRRSSLVALRSSLFVRRSSFVALRSSFAAPRSPLLVPRSSFVAPRSSFTVNPLFTVYGSVSLVFRLSFLHHLSSLLVLPSVSLCL